MHLDQNEKHMFTDFYLTSAVTGGSGGGAGGKAGWMNYAQNDGAHLRGMRY